MNYYRQGTHYNILDLYKKDNNQKYDYKRFGITDKMMSRVITETTNKTTRMILDFIEAVAQFLVEYTDELKNFKNPYLHKF